MILTKIYINNEQIDLKDDVSIPLNFNIADIREPEKRGTTWSKTVVLPGTSFNNALFSNIWNVNAAINSSGTTNFNPNFNPNLKAEAEITYNEARQFKGICQLLNVNVTDKYEIEYEVAFFGELQNVFQFFNNKYLRDINLSEYNHTYTAFNQQLSWTNPIGQGYLYPMIDYGKTLNSYFRVVDLYPSVYVKTIIDKMFSDAGFIYESNFLNSDLFKRLVIPYNGQSQLVLSDNQIKDRTFRATKTSDQNLEMKAATTSWDSDSVNGGYKKQIYYQDDTNSPNYDSGNVFTSQYTFTATRSGNYNFKTFLKLKATFKSEFTFSSAEFTFKSAQLEIRKNNTIIANVPIYIIPYGGAGIENSFNIYAKTLNININDTTTTGEGSLEIQALLKTNDVVECYIHATRNDFLLESYNDFYQFYEPQEGNLNLLSDSYFTGKLLDSTIQEGDTVVLSNALPDKIKQSDFFNSIVKMFNLFIEVDKANSKKLIIEPRPSFYSGGLIKDWSNKLDYSKETKIIPTGEVNSKTYKYTYKEDTDYFNSKYKQQTGEIYGEQKFEVLNDFLKGEVKTELIFSPTPLVDTIGHDRIIPKIYSLNSNGQMSYTPSNIRILYYGGLKTTAYQWAHTATSGTTGMSVYPYVGHLDDPLNPTIDINFGVPRQLFYTLNNWTSNNLYNVYWKDYVEQIADKDSKLFSGYFLINEFDVQDLDFRNTFYFENEYWRLNKIIDYDRINNKPTKCEFIKLKTLPPYIEDNGFETLGGTVDNMIIAPIGKSNNTFNNNIIADGAIVSGENNNIQSGDGIIVSGNNIMVSPNAKNVNVLSSSDVNIFDAINVSVTSSSGVTIIEGVSNVSITNSSGVTVTESNTTYDNNIKSYNNISYKKFVGLITQQSTSPPTIIILENTFTSAITSDYVGVGKYNLISSGEFTIDKTFIMINQSQNGISGPIPIITAAYSSTNEIYIETREAVDETYLNDSMNNCSIEIRVYS